MSILSLPTVRAAELAVLVSRRVQMIDRAVHQVVERVVVANVVLAEDLPAQQVEAAHLQLSKALVFAEVGVQCFRQGRRPDDQQEELIGDLHR